jgi:hypothetical protein
MVSDRSALFGGKLGQVLPATTTAQTLYTALATTEITRINICNVTNNNVSYYLYHDDGGTAYATANALVFNKTLSGHATDVIEAASQGSGITIQKNGSIGVAASVANHLNFTCYGIVQKAR